MPCVLTEKFLDLRTDSTSTRERGQTAARRAEVMSWDCGGESHDHNGSDVCLGMCGR